MKPVAVSLIEVKTLFEDGHRGRFLSYDQIVAEIRRRGGRISRSTLKRRINRWRALGLLDDEPREKLRNRAGIRPGGRRQRRVAYDPGEIRALHGAGIGQREIARRAVSLAAKGRSRGIVRRILRELGCGPSTPPPPETP